MWSDFQIGPGVSGLPPGTIAVLATDNKGCQAVDTLVIHDAVPITLTAAITDAGCTGINDGAIDLSVSNGLPPYSYLWNTLDTTEDLNGIPPGLYSVEVTDSAGCDAHLDVTVGQVPQLFIDLEGIESISCNGASDGAIHIDVSGGTPPYSYLWNNNNSTQDLLGIPTATYTLTVSDGAGCTLSDSYSIPEPPAINISVDSFSNVTCYEGADGSVTVSASGGVAPLAYSIDGIVFQSDNIFNGLHAGNYSVVVKDGNDCRQNTSIALTQGTEISITYGVDINIVNGQSTVLNPILTPDSLAIDTIIWSPVTGLSCISCLAPEAAPEETTIYTVVLIDEHGCQAETKVRIIVTDQYRIFIPNVFSPNGDGNNDRFSLWAYGTNTIAVRIFNRWGGEVYFKPNQVPNTDTDGWDGMFRGEEAQQGTYVYLIDILFENGEERQLTGSITLIR